MEKQLQSPSEVDQLYLLGLLNRAIEIEKGLKVTEPEWSDHLHHIYNECVRTIATINRLTDATLADEGVASAAIDLKIGLEHMLSHVELVAPSLKEIANALIPD
jgi:hypothetical protein